jgi:hypothetical protein
VVDRGKGKSSRARRILGKTWGSMIANRIKVQYLNLTVECIEDRVWNLNG